MEQKEKKNVYIIPSNYTDSGKWFWGLVEPRNAIEATILGVALLIGIFCLPISIYIRITMAAVIAIPVFVLACIGVNGDSLTQFLGHIINHFTTRKKMTFKRVGQSDENIKKKDKVNFVQDYIPIEDIRNGIIETTDGRYIKILEIEPINFNLRSVEEQVDIISDFQDYLKIAPVKVHFKTFTRKANSERHINQVREEVRNEIPQVKEYAEDYITLIKNVGQIEALSRRFFLILQYEPLRRSDITDYSQMFAQLYQAEHEARKYFEHCGNFILKPKDQDKATAEILYYFFNKNSCSTEPFDDRIRKFCDDVSLFNSQVKDDEDKVDVTIKDLIAPRGLNLTHTKYFTMDGLYYSVMHIKADCYPIQVIGGWTAMLVNAGDGIDIDIHIAREEHAKTIEKVGTKIRLNKSKVKGMPDTNSDYEALYGAIESGYFIKRSLANTNQDLYYMSIFVTITAKSYKELEWKKQELISMMKAKDIEMAECLFQQQDAFQTILPLGYIPPKLFNKAKRNVLTSGLASIYPFTSYEMTSDTGVTLGVNQHNNSLCAVDLFDTKVNKNANVNVVGTTGAGKTFTMQVLALRMRMRGIQSFIIAPTKGHEFKRACNYIGGDYIKIASGSPQN
ncbi:MAG: PrgI family protein, partial [Oscillospiraceae bacterium]|nr:PrgI family protein [Oscillospiraceae bacterium]